MNYAVRLIGTALSSVIVYFIGYYCSAYGMWDGPEKAPSQVSPDWFFDGSLVYLPDWFTIGWRRKGGRVEVC